MKRYKVTTEVTFIIRADRENDAIDEVYDQLMALEDCEPCGLYEVDEVRD